MRAWSDEIMRDLRSGLRQLRQWPVSTAVALLSFALAIGAATVLASSMEAVLWKPLSVRSSERLRLLSWVSGPRQLMNGISGSFGRTPGGGVASASFSYPVFLALQQPNDVFESVVAFRRAGRVTIAIDGIGESADAELVSGNFYSGIGLHPVLGRPIDSADDREGAEGVGLISHGFWMRRFGGDPSVIGMPATLNGRPITIIGVNPREFTSAERGSYPDIVLPLHLQATAWPWQGTSVLDNPDLWWLQIAGRLKPGVAEVRAEVALADRFRQAVRSSLPDRTDRDQPELRLADGSRGVDRLSDTFMRPLLILLALVGLLLLTACINVAALLLARARMRRAEIGLRIAMGASRGRVARQLFIEGLLFAALAGAVGLGVGLWVRDSIPSLLAVPWRPGPFEAELSWRVLGLSLASLVATGVAFSAVPALQVFRAGMPASALMRHPGSGAAWPLGWWRGRALCACQLSVVTALLIAAGLFVGTVWHLVSVDLGFQPSRVLLVVVDPPAARYPDERRTAVLDQLHEHVEAIPGVERATLSSTALLARQSIQVGVDADLTRGPLEQGSAWVNHVGRGFFETMGIPLLAGRSFSREDYGSPLAVTVVSRRFVQEFFPGEDPIGKRIRTANDELVVVGVVGDARYGQLRTPYPPTFYRLYAQVPPGTLGPMTFAVRSGTALGSLTSAIREAVRSVDAELPIFDVRTQDAQVRATIGHERLFAALASVFALIAAALAAVGIYGMVEDLAVRRTREVAVRLALGATEGQVMWMIVRDGLLASGAGAIAGAAAAAALTPFIEGALFGVGPREPAVIVAAVTLVLAISTLAAWLPVRRVSRLAPMSVLRQE